MRTTPWLLLALAAAFRGFGCFVTPVPGRDAGSYLWQAEQWATGHSEALFATVFHPLYPLLVGLCLKMWPSLDLVIAGQIAAAGTGALAVLPIWWLAQRMCGDAAALWATCMYAIGTWFVRHPADCMSEGPFYLLATLWAAALLGSTRRPALAGLAAGLAFLARPEGAVLAVIGMLHLLANGHRRAAVLHAAVAAALCALLPLGSLAAGHGFSLTPKAAFNWDVGAGGADSAVAFYFGQWLRLPGDAWEGLGYLVFPLAIAGAIRNRPRSFGDARWCLILPFVAQCLVVPLLKSHHRFVSGLGVLLLPFAGALFAELIARGRARGQLRAPLLVLALFASEAKLLVDWPADRTIERDVGRWLRDQRTERETVATDMPRVLLFAGLPPLPPRRLEPADVLTMAAEPNCRFVALRPGRTVLAIANLAQLGYARTPLPSEFSAHPHRDEIELFRR